MLARNVESWESRGHIVPHRRPDAIGIASAARRTPETEDDIAEYFEACLQEGGDDPVFIAHAFGVIARARGMSQVARDAGISREGL